MATFTCPECENLYDTCGFCNGSGRVVCQSEELLDRVIDDYRKKQRAMNARLVIDPPVEMRVRLGTVRTAGAVFIGVVLGIAVTVPFVLMLVR